MPQTLLRFLPIWSSPLEFRVTGTSKAKLTLTPILRMNFRYPSLPVHNAKCSSQGGAIHRQDFPEPALGEVPSERKCLQNRELRNGQSYNPQRFVITLGDCSAGATNTRAHAGK